MPTFRVETPRRVYPVVVNRGVVRHAAHLLPERRGKLFVISTDDVWLHQGAALETGLAGVVYETIFLPGGEGRKRLEYVEAAAEEMVRRGADRSSLVVAFGGGIVGDMAGFLAAIFMRGIPVIQIPTTLLAQVDASVGGKTGVNLDSGKNLIGVFHQPLAVLIDPDTLNTLPEREYRAGLSEVLKTAVIRDAELFRFLDEHSAEVLARQPAAVDRAIADSVRIKTEVVSADEREGDLRRILNFGHTIGHALEAETGYTRFLHGEAVAFGMRAAVYLSQRTCRIAEDDAASILGLIESYGSIPSLEGIEAERLLLRLVHDKKTIQGHVHFVLPVRVGEVAIAADIDEALVLSAIEAALQ
jgi:3-dehydroquinate synthase